MSWERPVFILTRDRLECVKQLTDWLERAACENIVFLDSASTYEPMRDWLRDSPHTVHWLSNERSKANSLLWESGLMPDGPFAHCAPDVLPAEDCPLDALEYCWELLERHGGDKAGLGIVHDDLEPGVRAREGIAGRLGATTRAELESLEQGDVVPGVCWSAIDHTFCVYRRSAGADDLAALRTKRPSPYMIRHVPFYEHPPFTPDVQHYIDHARSDGPWASWIAGNEL